MNTQRPYSMTRRAEQASSTADRIAEAAVELFMNQRFADVTLAAIAGAAGVSHQTVLNHFESKEGVAYAVAERVSDATDDARADPPVGDPAAAVAILIDDYERMGDANVRWAMDAAQLGSLTSFLERARRSHRAWLATAFQDRLPTAPDDRDLVLTALYAATDVYTWKLLRRDLERSRDDTERIVLHLVHGALAPR
jgi:AcrR family transcriptional regulator